MPTTIEWAEETVSPIRTETGGWHCVKCSPGCAHCYAETINKRFGDGLPYNNRKVKYKFNLDILEKVKKRKKPKRIFWQSMGDLFLPDIALNPFCRCDPPCTKYDAQSNHGTMLKILLRLIYHLDTPHTHIFLTKRPEIALEFYQRWNYLWDNINNLFLGVSCENQEQADKRIPILLEIPAAVRFVSCEPLLSSLDLNDYLIRGLDWCIIGAESGVKASPMKEEWVRGLIEQCKKAEVPVFYKQQIVNGKKIPLPIIDGKRYTEFPQIIGKQSVF